MTYLLYDQVETYIILFFDTSLQTDTEKDVKHTFHPLLFLKCYKKIRMLIMYTVDVYTQYMRQATLESSETFKSICSVFYYNNVLKPHLLQLCKRLLVVNTLYLVCSIMDDT